MRGSARERKRERRWIERGSDREEKSARERKREQERGKYSN